MEPWLNRAIALAKGYGLIELESGRGAKLTDPGVELFEEIEAANMVLAEEKAFLDAVGGAATEARIDKIMRMEALL